MQIIIIISVVVILLLTLLLMRNKSMVVQRFAVLEFVMVLLVMSGYFFVTWKNSSLMTEQYLSYYEKSMDMMTAFTNGLDEIEISTIESENDEWETSLQDALASAFPVKKVEENEVSLSVAIFAKNGAEYDRVYVSGENKNLGKSLAFKKAAANAIEDTYANQTARAIVFEDSCMIMLADTDANVPRRMLCVEVPVTDLNQDLENLRTTILYIVLIIWALGSVIAYMVVSLQDLEWKKLTNAISTAATGRNDWKRPAIHNSEMQILWNSFGELVKSIARSNYDKYRMFQAYYRFAPKKIEKILQKSSIIDVTNGDIADIDGTLVLASMSGDQTLNQREYARGMGAKYHILTECQKRENGIALTGDCDIRNLKYIFIDEKLDAVKFGVEALSAFESAGIYQREAALLLVHYSNFTYGILGDEEQASSFIISKEMEMLSAYKERLRSAGVRMVITDSIADEITDQYTYRYIGYIEEDGMAFKLYEVLDVYSEKERRIRMHADEKFQQAIELYYQDDFYLARNVFTDVLKECPEDGLAKWYMFACEYHLDHPEIDDISYGLFDRDINWQ